ncbi:thiol-disulfide isomerase-like thioredoxin [Burkholderiales bacterium JOSHI_001]|nr:thiol-disulfide isomerase-like thioredoxin [Burkholderiales bacterium JOSHI_001]
MLSLSLGPIALPVAPLVALLSVWGAATLASRLAAKAAGASATAPARDVAGNAVFMAALLGLLAARAAHLSWHGDLYAASPWLALDLRDGGLNAWAGAMAAAAWLLWRGLRAPTLRGPLAAGTLLGVALWATATLVVGEDEAAAMPRMALMPLEGGVALDLPAAARGRPVVVNLWASWCGPCRQEMPVLAAAQQRETQVGFLFVNQGESLAVVRAYLAHEGLPLREVLMDPDSRLGPAVGSPGLPTTLFYDAQGRRFDAHFGALSAPALERRLRQMRGAL